MTTLPTPYADLLSAYAEAEPLPDTINPDGKSLYNPPGPRSAAYDAFPLPIDSSNNGFDFHIYYMQAVDAHKTYARALHERIRREFPELRIYKFWEKPIGKQSLMTLALQNTYACSIGPHPVAMFEINTFTPHQTGALFSWLVVHRGPCSVLIHPNTNDAYADHTELATWIGKPWPLYVDVLKREARFGPGSQQSQTQPQQR